MRFVTIEIDGTTYQIRFTHNSVAEMEQVAGMGLGSLFDRAMSFAALRYLLWAGLKTASTMRGLTLEQAGVLISKYHEQHGSTDELSAVLWKGLEVCGFVKVPKEEGEKKEALPPTQTPTTTSETSATAPTAG